MDTTDIRAFYDAVSSIGRDKLDRSEYEARHSSLETRVNKLEMEQDTRYETILKMISDIKDSLSRRDETKLQVIFAAVLSFIGGGGLIGALYALRILH